jgi:hypothetical protein
MRYKIIIPKEEPKCTCKEHDPYCCQVHGTCPTCVKQEELKTNLERLPFLELIKEFAEYYKKVPLVEKPKQENCCPKCGELENFHYNYDYSKVEKVHILDILCNECGELFPPILKLPKQKVMKTAMQELIDWATSLQYNQQQCIDWITIKNKAEQLLEKEKPKQECTCENPTDNTCGYCEKENKIEILEEAKKRALEEETLEDKRSYQKHSLTKTKGYKLWCNIIQRCYNPKNHSYKYYGEKGVVIEDYFKNSYENFINWIKGLANYENWVNSSELSLDRIDNSLGYIRGNIKFSTKTEQVENQNLRIDNKSGYKGVCYHKINKKYGATITINKSKIFLGYYDTALEAALVYDNYVLKNNLNRKTNL